jgi:hypothetical protein
MEVARRNTDAGTFAYPCQPQLRSRHRRSQRELRILGIATSAKLTQARNGRPG